jgi:hypothetical protein
MAPLSESHNPFSTRFVRPGAIRYRFTEVASETPQSDANDTSQGTGLDAEPERQRCWESILGTLRASGWWGQIVGPHGTGKSTLLVELLARLDREGVGSAHFELHDGQRRFPYSLDRLLEHEPIPHLIVIDGYEQLGFWSRRQVTRWCRRRSVGLLVTTHVPFHFPTIFETEVSVRMAESLVYRHLESIGSDVSITPEEIRTRFESSDGSVRELFFSLYDLVEKKRRK